VLSADHAFEPLTPTAYLDRSSIVFGNAVAVVDGEVRLTYRELRSRALRLAGALSALGVTPGDRVAVLAPNSELLLTSHYAVPYAGAVLVALNVRLNPVELAWIVGHSGSKVLVFDAELADVATRIAAECAHDVRLISAGDELEGLIADADEAVPGAVEERSMLAINYSSGTTGRPKGVVYHHRGAYLQALAMSYHMGLGPDTVFLWTLPMFHCNGWCHTWAVTAAGGQHLCIPSPDPAEVWRHIRDSGVTHFNAAPAVLTPLAYHPDAAPAPNRIQIATGGAPPSPTLLARLAELDMDVTHLYGLTETYGPSVVCQLQASWDGDDAASMAALKARQGVANVVNRQIRVVADDGTDVAADGEAIAEVALHGNTVMAGYYLDPEATANAVRHGWFRTGDLGVMHPDGYIELKDRLKDVIISGGENISSIEVENAVASHPAVLEVAVIGVPDEKWGERPRAYVTLKADASADAAEIIAHVRDRLAGFKAPSTVEFGPLPKTSTGKIQKYLLREAAWAGQARRIN
jgi:fatty-acyl-CoA synthase